MPSAPHSDHNRLAVSKVMTRPYLSLCFVLSLASPGALAADAIANSDSPRFEIERDWSGELRPRYKGPQPEEAISAPVITPESPRITRKTDHPPKIEVWDKAVARPRENRDREGDRRRTEARAEREWRDREWAARDRAEREWEEREDRSCA